MDGLGGLDGSALGHEAAHVTLDDPPVGTGTGGQGGVHTGGLRQLPGPGGHRRARNQEIFFQDGDEVPCLVNVCAIGAKGEDCSALRPDGAAPAAPAAQEAPAAQAAGP